MRTFIIIIAFFVMFSSTIFASEIGRYQAIYLQESKDSLSKSVLILDTKEGHIWLWTEGTVLSFSDKPVFPVGYFLKYMGKVRPGTKMGQVIEKFIP